MYKIVETIQTEKDQIERTVALYTEDEYDMCIKHWEDWLRIASNANTKVQLVRNGKVMITYDQLKMSH